MDIKDIQQAIDMRCRRRARHLCKIYAEEQSGGLRSEYERIYAETKSFFGLNNIPDRIKSS